jgi:hypothetical protein
MGPLPGIPYAQTVLNGGDVPEGNMNAEIANHLREHDHHDDHPDRGPGSHFRSTTPAT